MALSLELNSGLLNYTKEKQTKQELLQANDDDDEEGEGRGRRRKKKEERRSKKQEARRKEGIKAKCTERGEAKAEVP